MKYGFRLKASFIPGKFNILSDLISRIHSVESTFALQNFLGGNENNEVECVGNMSEKSFLLLQESWGQMM